MSEQGSPGSPDLGFSYSRELTSKTTLLDMRFQQCVAEISKMEALMQGYSKGLERQMTTFRSLRDRRHKFSCLHSFAGAFFDFYLLGGSSNQSALERCTERFEDIVRLKKYVETNRKFLVNRATRNEKTFARHHRLLESMQRKQHQAAKVSHQWFVRHHRCLESSTDTPASRQELDSVELKFIHAVNDEKKYSQQYEDIVKQTHSYQEDFVEENRQILSRYQEFDLLILKSLKTHLLQFVQDLREFAELRVRELADLAANIERCDAKEMMADFVRENRTEFTEPPKHTYDPFIPIYKRSQAEKRQILESDEGSTSDRGTGLRGLFSIFGKVKGLSSVSNSEVSEDLKRRRRAKLARLHRVVGIPQRKSVVPVTPYVVKVQAPEKTTEVIFFMDLFYRLTGAGRKGTEDTDDDGTAADDEDGGEEEDPFLNSPAGSGLRTSELSRRRRKPAPAPPPPMGEMIVRARQLLETFEGRNGFALSLNYERGAAYITDFDAFSTLAELVGTSLTKSLENQDKDVGKMLLNMCQTFYTIIDEEQTYWIKFLKDLAIWKSMRYWEGVFYDTMNQMREKSQWWQSQQKWADLDGQAQAEREQEHANMTFGVLTSIVFSMIEAGMNQRKVREFIDKMCALNELSLAQTQLIRTSFEEMLRQKRYQALGSQ